MAKPNEIGESKSINILGEETTVKGDITLNGDIRIDGTLIGSVTSKGKLIIGSSGKVEGEISCQNGDFSGFIKAKVRVNELLQLKATAKLVGDIFTNKLAIEPGAKFTGTCNMDGIPPTTIIKEDKPQEKNEPVRQKTAIP